MRSRLIELNMAGFSCKKGSNINVVKTCFSYINLRNNKNNLIDLEFGSWSSKFYESFVSSQLYNTSGKAKAEQLTFTMKVTS